MRKFTKSPVRRTKPHLFSYSIHGKHYDLPIKHRSSKTKEDILMESTILFSARGYANVSIRDITNIIKIKASSLYNHFESKEGLWKQILAHSFKLYMLYVKEIDKLLSNENRVNDMLNIIFSEPKKMDNIFTCYAFGMVQREHIYNETADKIFQKVLCHYLKILKKHFDRCIDINPEVSTHAMAIMSHSIIFYGINSKTRDVIKTIDTHDYAELFESVKRIFLSGIESKNFIDPAKDTCHQLAKA